MTPNFSEGFRETGLLQDSEATPPVLRIDFEERLNSIDHFFPISPVAAEVVRTCSSGMLGAEGIAALIQKDAGLTVEVLRKAHRSPDHTRGSNTNMLVRQAVSRLGQRRLAEIVFTTRSSAISARGILPWLDMSLVWKRSMAAGIAADWVSRLSGHTDDYETLRLAAMMHPLGRVVLGILYAEQYDQMVRRAAHGGKSVDELEKEIFPLKHGHALARLFQLWRFPERLRFLLAHSQDSEEDLARLETCDRRKVQEVQLAISIAMLAVNSWQTWEEIPLPHPQLSRVLEDDLEELFAFIRDELPEGDGFDGWRRTPEELIWAVASDLRIGYVNLSLGHDPMPRLLGAMGIRISPYRASQNFGEPVLINCRGIEPREWQALPLSQCTQAIVLCDRKRIPSYQHYSNVISLPASYGQLRKSCLEAIKNCQGHRDRSETPVTLNPSSH